MKIFCHLKLKSIFFRESAMRNPPTGCIRRLPKIVNEDEKSTWIEDSQDRIIPSHISSFILLMALS